MPSSDDDTSSHDTHRPVLYLGTNSDPHLHFVSVTQWVTDTGQR